LSTTKENVDEGEYSNDSNSPNITQDYIKYSKSINMEVLSPDVKEFLRKNRIRVRKNQAPNINTMNENAA
jgi:hypothetical protein